MKSILLPFTVALWLGCSTLAASAQLNHERDFYPPYSLSDVEGFLADYGLEESDAAVLIRDFAEEFIAQYRAAWQDVDAVMKESPSFDARADWEVRRRTIIDGFEREARIILDEEYRDAWDAFTALSRRARILDRINPGGTVKEWADLSKVILAAPLRAEDHETLKPILSQYLADLDVILIDFDNQLIPLLREYHAAARDAEQGQHGAKERMDRFRNQFRAFDQQLAALNKNWTDRVLGEANPDSRGVLRQTLTQRRYERLYVESPVDMIVGALRAAEQPPAGLDAIEQVYQIYEARRDALRTHVVHELDRWNEPKRRAERDALYAELSARWHAGENVSLRAASEGCGAVEPMIQLIELESATVRQIRSVIQPDEFARLSPGIRALIEWGVEPARQ